MKKIKIVIFVGIMMVIPFFIAQIYQILSIPSYEISSEALKDYKYKLFYRSDCKDCHQLFKKSLLKLKKKNTVFIDMSLEANKKYREEYAIVFVPTLYVGEEEYIGISDIQKQLNK